MARQLTVNKKELKELLERSTRIDRKKEPIERKKRPNYKKQVRKLYPEAICQREERTHVSYWVWDTNSGKRLSGNFKNESSAWKDALAEIKKSERINTAKTNNDKDWNMAIGFVRWTQDLPASKRVVISTQKPKNWIDWTCVMDARTTDKYYVRDKTQKELWMEWEEINKPQLPNDIVL